MEHRERRLGLARARVGERARVEERLGERGRAREQLGAHARRRGREQRLEQLPDDAEGELALELAAARGEHAHVVAERCARLGQQARLADAGAALDHDQRAVAGARPLGEREDRRELAVALEERPLARVHRRRRDAEPQLEQRLGPVEPGQARLPSVSRRRPARGRAATSAAVVAVSSTCPSAAARPTQRRVLARRAAG